ncbi:phosphatidylglycerophosphatase A family protein [Sulfurovum sp. NBC37-1]|uniref:phosphatidylglycerophosphatase A family protein n=1 Tax=Sulfurovum sp. (strain NBC37-1) TaxID=387093 RepID=UPI0001587510|nr:phosphatidylglycerophosphatase A [Sulfurovum sp. NBC37-1]BAF71479.1 phosphatidylglycerophosphatase A [Sulfurovum sp. NBC37-1]
MTLQTLFLTFFGTGLSPQYPKTVATFAALILGIAILHYLGMETLFMLAFAVTVIGIFEINKYENLGGEHHAKEIVIDAATGMWLSLMIASSTAATLHYPSVNILAIVFSFAAYRFFDIWKPSTIGWIDREVKGGLGVMMDDVLSGIAGGLLSVVILMGIGKLF